VKLEHHKIGYKLPSSFDPKADKGVGFGYGDREIYRRGSGGSSSKYQTSLFFTIVFCQIHPHLIATKSALSSTNITSERARTAPNSKVSYSKRAMPPLSALVQAGKTSIAAFIIASCPSYIQILLFPDLARMRISRGISE